MNFGDSVRAKRSYGIPGDSEIRVDVANQTDAVWEFVNVDGAIGSLSG